METHYTGYIKIGQPGSGESGLDWDEMGDLSESINNDPDGVMATLRLRKSSNEVHSNFFPFQFRDSQGLE
jgi:hypothetical protein